MQFIVLSLPFLLLVGSFTEVIVFNEEVLLALCFVFFVFCAYSYLNESVTEAFESRATKFESDILAAFQSKYITIVTFSSGLLESKAVLTGFALYEACLISYFAAVSNKLKSSRQVTLISVANQKLAEVSSNNRRIKSLSLQANLESLVFPIVFTLVTKSLVSNLSL